jgi:hypothetical protein
MLPPESFYPHRFGRGMPNPCLNDGLFRSFLFDCLGDDAGEDEFNGVAEP